MPLVAKIVIFIIASILNQAKIKLLLSHCFELKMKERSLN